MTFAGFATVEAGDGEAALSAVRQAVPALMIVDIVMPNRDGLDLIAAVKSDFPTIKILAISGGSARATYGELLTAARGLGADDYLVKPFLNDEIVGRVRSLLSKDA